jgi:hypothetical protein
MDTDVNKMIKVYLKIRDAKETIQRQTEEAIAELDAQLAVIEQELLEFCKTANQDGGRTEAGTFTRMIKDRFWTNNWEAMRRFIVQNDAVDLLEQRIHQTNMKAFLAANPDKLPEGLNVDRKYTIRVTRPRAK